MTFSKLKYCRSLVEEERKIESLLVDERKKCRRNTEKIELLNQTRAEVRSNSVEVKKEVIDWISHSKTSTKLKKEMEEFFIKGRGALSSNFHRDVEYLLGENKSYKPKKD